jgi:ActR/RegA family two-component response regulator
MLLGKQNGDADTMLDHRDTPATAAGLQLTETISPTLLVIDDDTVHRMILSKVGQRAGFTVTGAATYDEAVTRLRQTPFTVVTLDLSLGQHGGVEVLNVFAEIGFKGQIIIVSGTTETVRKETTVLGHQLRLNVCCSLPKPVDLAHLRTILQEIKERKAVGLMNCA